MADGHDNIILGVTGHRWISKDDRHLRRQIADLLHDLAARNPNSTFTVLSALAEGADRLVADVAMEDIDATLVTVLPLPEETYEHDFENSASINVFRHMLALAEHVVRAPLPTTTDAWRDYGEVRNRRYAWAGAYVAAYSDVLFALWDRKPARGTGGTAQVIKWFEERSVPRQYSTVTKTTPLGRAHHPRSKRSLIIIDPGSP